LNFLLIIFRDKEKDGESLEEKNKKKKLAILAAKEDGNAMFKQGKYDLALQIYERVKIF
jgi:hypothetical protein